MHISFIFVSFLSETLFMKMKMEWNIQFYYSNFGLTFEIKQEKLYNRENLYNLCFNFVQKYTHKYLYPYNFSLMHLTLSRC